MIGISIIIPTLNRSAYLKNTLDNLLDQEFDFPYEILIIDQSPRQDDLILKHTEGKSIFRYYHIMTFQGLPEARNFGAQNALHNILVYVDDDIECEKDFLQQHFNLHRKLQNLGVLAGGITEKFKDNINCEIGKFVKKSGTPLRGFHQKDSREVDHGGGGNFSVKRDVYLKVNGVDEYLTKGSALYEETDFCLRVKKLGYKIWFHYDAHVFHLAAATGGCRVVNIEKYVYNLIRNRSLIIERHLDGVDKITATLELFRLTIAYTLSYKKASLLGAFCKARKEGRSIGRLSSKMTNYA